MYERMTVDVEQLFTLVLQDALNEATRVHNLEAIEVFGRQDTDAAEHVPFVVVNAHNGRMLNGPNAWEWDVFISIVGQTRDDAADIADMVYRAMHLSHDMNVRYPGVGSVTSVDDVSMPSHTSTSLTPAGDLTQFDGTFHVIVRKS